MKRGISSIAVLIAAAMTMLAFLALFSVSTGTAQEETRPCPKPYIKTIFGRAGLPGDQVKIRGRRFGTEEGKVFFSPKLKAEVVEWSNSQIWVVVPKAATTGPVTVSRPCGAVSNETYFKVIE